MFRKGCQYHFSFFRKRFVSAFLDNVHHFPKGFVVGCGRAGARAAKKFILVKPAAVIYNSGIGALAWIRRRREENRYGMEKTAVSGPHTGL